MHTIAQFGARKKSRNAVNNECASHTISRTAEQEECENADQLRTRIASLRQEKKQGSRANSCCNSHILSAVLH